MEPKSSIDRATAAKDVQIVALADTSARPAATHSEESFTKSITAVTVRLSQGKFALIDLEDEERVSAIKWSAYWTRWAWYAASHRGGKNLYLHRFILNAPDDRQVDHISGDGLDCRKANLRLATNGQNSANRRKKSGPSSSRYKGVDLHADKWRARIRKDKIQTCIGHFDSPEAAAHAYDAKARELHGEFARLNFPEAKK